VAYNFEIGNDKIKLLTEYENVTQNVLFGNAMLAAFMSGRKYDVILQNVDCSNQYAYFGCGNNAASLQNSIWKRSTFR
jgi:hypothetical protein